MEEHLGSRVNHNRVDEALTLDPATIATGCPFCRVMLSDGVGDRGKSESVEVVDVAQLLLGPLDRGTLTLPEKGTAATLAAAFLTNCSTTFRKILKRLTFTEVLSARSLL